MRLQFAIAILVFSLRNAENQDVGRRTTSADEDVTAMNGVVRQIFDDVKQRGADGTKKVADQETKASVTLINQTDSGGFMPSFHLGPGISGFPLINIPNQPAAANSNGNQSGRLTANSNRLNSIFNNVRAITFDSNMSSDNESQRLIPLQRQQQQQPQLQPPPPEIPTYRPADPLEKLVKFIEDKEDGDKRLYHHDEQQDCLKQSNKLTSHGYGEQATALLHEPNHHHHHHHHQLHQVENSYADVSYNTIQQQPQPQQHQYGSYEAAKPTKFLHEVPSYQYNAYESKLPVKYHHDSPSYSAPMTYHQTIIPVENTFKYYHPNQIHDSYHSSLDHNKLMLKPEAVISYHPTSYQSASSTYDHTKPKTVLFVTHHEDRKFPYNYYQAQPQQQQQSFEQHTDWFGAEQHHDYQYPLYYEHQKSVSPWKKILHIIGAFLPLGLLFALLSPKLVTATTNSQSDPSIILSKLRVNDLLAEHKKSSNNNNNNRANAAADALDTESIAATLCEERSICRLLLATDSRTAEFLRQLVLRVTERTLESAVKKQELDGVFEAAKLGNCDVLTCSSFYDAT